MNTLRIYCLPNRELLLCTLQAWKKDGGLEFDNNPHSEAPASECITKNSASLTYKVRGYKIFSGFNPFRSSATN